MELLHVSQVKGDVEQREKGVYKLELNIRMNYDNSIKISKLLQIKRN